MKTRMLWVVIILALLVGCKKKEGRGAEQAPASSPPLVSQSQPQQAIPCEFNIEGVDVVSVERDFKDGVSMTYILYRTPAGEEREDRINTTEEQHANFVQRFQRKIGTERR